MKLLTLSALLLCASLPSHAATASDGQPVFYELDLAADGTPPRILSFGLHFPAADGRSAQRADRLVKSIAHPAP